MTAGTLDGVAPAPAPNEDDVLLTVTDLVQRFRVPGGVMNAVAGVGFELKRGRTLGLVGESGCGKSTLARAILQLTKPTAGSVLFDGQELTKLNKEALRVMRRRIQMVFQDPISALNPRRKIKDIVGEGLVIAGVPKEEVEPRVAAMLRKVGLDPDLVSERRPHQFSGGQCQRIAIARAMVVNPDLLICDEPVASLDVSVQAQVLDLLDEMKASTGVSMIFVAHDLAVVRNISDDVAVMYLGTICETGDTDAIYDSPAHPYTRALLDAVPAPNPGAQHSGPALKGEIPSPMNPPSGCRFRTRCPLASPRCGTEVPQLREVAPGHRVACHYPLVGDVAPELVELSATVEDTAPEPADDTPEATTETTAEAAKTEVSKPEASKTEAGPEVETATETASGTKSEAVDADAADDAPKAAEEPAAKADGEAAAETDEKATEAAGEAADEESSEAAEEASDPPGKSDSPKAS
ncbi:ABC transporter ATP-binding protein [Streptodolium elevatio]|uniref:Oligopeptide/dipeptide ABC transporter ATP-binding protein n=1 Tax=Streptodolium elevatio TaxID=3157996 RepID=A0ABV3D9C7_9ACTN